MIFGENVGTSMFAAVIAVSVALFFGAKCTISWIKRETPLVSKSVSVTKTILILSSLLRHCMEKS